MIARIVFVILLVLFLPQLYLDYYKYRQDKLWVRILHWLSTVAMMGVTVVLAFERDFVPYDMTVMNIYLIVLFLIFVPKAIYVLCSMLGKFARKTFHTRYNWGNAVGLFLGACVVFIVAYGSFIGVRKLDVNRMEISIPDLPEAFDGYRIVVFSDAHVGSFTGWREQLLKRDFDSINAQKPDAIFFVGDLQNMRPIELYPVRAILNSLEARDGVFSVLGNHDYSDYIDDDPAVKAANEREIVNRQRWFGWTPLLNGHVVLKRGATKERLVIAGVECNASRGDLPKVRTDVAKALRGVRPDDCVILLRHDPTNWRLEANADPRVKLTLGGHTHGGQVSLFGFRPTELRFPENYGLYREGDHQLYVTSGIGGLIPFRFGVSPEIAVITLRRMNN